MEQEFYCPQCNNPVGYGTRFCDKCGFKFGDWGTVEGGQPTATQQPPAEAEKPADMQETPGNAPKKSARGGCLKKVLCGVVALVAVLGIIGYTVQTPEGAVADAIQARNLDPVMKLYEDTHADERYQLAYAVAGQYIEKSREAIQKKDTNMLDGILGSLGSVPSLAREHEEFGLLLNVAERLRYADAQKKRMADFEREFKQKHGFSIRDVAGKQFVTAYVYIARKLTNDDGFVAYNVKSIPQYDTFGYSVYQSGTYQLPGDECVGVFYGQTFPKSGAYELTAYEDGDIKLKSETGFEQTVKKYRVVPARIDRELEFYKKMKQTDNPLPALEKLAEVQQALTKQYGKTCPQNLKLLGCDAGTVNNVLRSSYKQIFSNRERVGQCTRYNCGVTQVEGDFKFDDSLSFGSKDAEVRKSIKLSNGIGLGAPMEDVKTRMKDYYLASHPVENNPIYVLPNAQQIQFYIADDGTVREIAFRRCMEVKN